MPRWTLALLLTCACALHAQEYRSTLTGRITDPAGSGVPDAKVTATKLDTNQNIPTVSGPEGFYTIPQLLPGTYEITAEVKGFKKYVQTGIELASTARLAVDIQLTLGATTESVTVTSDAPPLQTVSASAGQAITMKEVENLPINGRAPMDLAVMAYGVVNTGVRDQNRPYENGGFSNLAMGGAGNGNNEVLTNGVPITGTIGITGRRAGFSPPVDGVAEVKVDVLNVDASFGGAGGGTVQIITKSGTNGLHGAVSEFNQRKSLNATPFFTNSAGGQKTDFKQNQWGTSVGGPLWVPKVYDGRNKVFWFFNYEGHKNSEPLPTYTTVPTAKERTGDFSELLALGPTYQLYDPASAALSGTVVKRTPFVGNLIPGNRLSPVTQKYLGYIPTPNFNYGTKDFSNNYFSPLTTNNSYYAFSGRLDFDLSSRNRLSFNIQNSFWSQNSGILFENIARGEVGSRAIWGGMLDDVHTFSPTVVGNLRFGFSRYRAYYDQSSVGFDSTTLGFPSYITANATKQLMPVFTMSDGFLSSNPATNMHYSDQPYNIYQAFGSVTKIAGSHTLKFGGEHRVMDFTNLSWSASTGSYTFDNGSFVKADNSTSSSPAFGGSMAQFLLGLPTSGSYTINAPSKNDSLYEVLFVQDDWHARPNLTFNFGLRWEYNGPTTERWNRLSNGFNAGVNNGITAQANANYAALYPTISAKNPLLNPSINAIGGLTFASADNRAPTTMPKKDFSPRFGVSWSPTAMKGKTVVRVGAGIFDTVYGPIVPQQPGFSNTTTLVATNDSYLTPAMSLSNPFPSGIALPPGAANGLNTYLGQGITFLNPNTLRQYNIRWTFDLQQELSKNTTLEIGYIGNHGIHLTNNYSFGALPVKYLSTSPTRDASQVANASALSSTVTNPFAGLLPGTSLNGSTISVSNLLRQFPEFSSVTEANMNSGGSYFHQLSMRLSRRLSHGFLLSFDYSHSRLMESNSYLNSGEMKLEKHVSTDDRPDNVGISALYQLPFGRGKHFWANAGGLANMIVGDWAVSTLYNYHSGAPMNWNADVIYYGGNLNWDAHNVNHTFDTTQFNTNSSQQLTNHYRTFSSYFSNLRVDATNNVNLSATKDFRIKEAMKLQFRADAFNLTNHPLFAAPTIGVTSGSFGQISSTTNAPRVIQLGLRLTF
jgi:hypothetical protein